MAKKIISKTDRCSQDTWMMFEHTPFSQISISYFFYRVEVEGIAHLPHPNSKANSPGGKIKLVLVGQLNKLL